MNDGIKPELCFLSHASVDNAVVTITCLAKGTLFIKLDLESAYQIILVHPENRLPLGMEWGRHWFVDTAFWFALCPENIHCHGR